MNRFQFIAITFILHSFIFCETARADWPLWSGGHVINYRYSTSKKTFKKIEIYDLSLHKEDTDWKIIFDGGGSYSFKVFRKKRSNKSWPTQPYFEYKKKLFKDFDDVIYISKRICSSTGCRTEIPIAISKVIDRYSFKKNKHKQKDIPNWGTAQSPHTGDYMTFTTTKAVKWRKKRRRVGGVWLPPEPAIGKLSGFYGDARFGYFIPRIVPITETLLCSRIKSYLGTRMPARMRSILVGIGYHKGIDIVAPAGTTVGILQTNHSNLNINVFNVGKYEEGVSLFKNRQIYYNYIHIDASDVILRRTILKNYANIKLGEISEKHDLLRHLHFEIGTFFFYKTKPYFESRLNPLESTAPNGLGQGYITPIDPNPISSKTSSSSTRVQVLQGTFNKKQVIFIKKDDYEKNNKKNFVVYDKKEKIFTVKGKVDIIAGGDQYVGIRQKLKKEIGKNRRKIILSGILEVLHAGIREAQYKFFALDYAENNKKFANQYMRKSIGYKFFQKELPDYESWDNLYSTCKPTSNIPILHPFSVFSSKWREYLYFNPQHFYILTNNTDIKQGTMKLDQRGCWDTNEKLNTSTHGQNSSSRLFPDGTYEIQVRFRSHLDGWDPRTGTFSIPQWSGNFGKSLSGTKASQKVIVDNTPPKVTNFALYTVGGRSNQTIKLGDTLRLYLSFDQPMSQCPRKLILQFKYRTSNSSKLLSHTITKTNFNKWVIRDFNSEEVINGQKPFKSSNNKKLFIKNALCVTIIRLPNSITSAKSEQLSGELLFSFSKGRGIGAFTHIVGNLKLENDEMFPVKCLHKQQNSTASISHCILMDSKYPKISLSQNANKVTLTCADDLSGLKYCLMEAPKNSQSCSSILQKSMMVTKTYPQKCKPQTITVKGWTENCAGHRAKANVKSLSEPDLTKKLIIPKLSCPPKITDKPCVVITEIRSCAEPSNSPAYCKVKKTIRHRKNIPSCDHPDDNVDLSNHSLAYKDVKNISVRAKLGVLDGPYSPHAFKLLASFKEQGAIIPKTFSPQNLLKKHPMLLLPSGSLMNEEGNKALKQALEMYVKAGGKLLVMGQAWGREWSILPGNLKAKGWNEAISCFWNATYIAKHHAVLSSAKYNNTSVPVDGYFTQLPKNTEVLLRKKSNDQPVLIRYQYGKGIVVATTAYTDWAYYWSQATADGRGIFRDILTWLDAPNIPILSKNNNYFEFPINFTNKGNRPADYVRLRFLSPDRQVITHQQIKQRVNVGEKSKITFIHHKADYHQKGIHRTELTLLSKEGHLVYGPIELPKERIIFSNKGKIIRYREGLITTFKLLEDNVISQNQSSIEVEVTIKNNLPKEFLSPRSLHVYVEKEKFDLTLAIHQVWKKRIKVSLTSTTGGYYPIHLVIFDKNAPQISKPSFAKKYNESWQYVASSIKDVYIIEPLMFITNTLTRTFYAINEEIQFSVDMTNITDCSYSGQTKIRLVDDKGKILWQKEDKHLYKNGEKYSLPIKIKLPSTTGKLTLITEIFDISGKKPQFISRNEQFLNILIPKLSIALPSSSMFQISSPVNVTITALNPIKTKGTVQLELYSPTGKLLARETKQVALEANQQQILSFHILPPKFSLGNYLLKYSAKTDFDESKGELVLPSRMKLGFSISTTQLIRNEEEKVAIDLSNEGVTELKPLLSWRLGNNILVGSAKSIQLVGQSRIREIIKLKVPVTAKAGRYPLRVKLSFYDGKFIEEQIFVTIKDSTPKMDISIDKTKIYAGGRVNIDVQIRPDNNIQAPYRALLKVSVPQLNYSNQQQIHWAKNETKKLSFSLAIPSVVKAGKYKVLSELTLPDGKKIAQVAYFSILEGQLAISLVNLSARPGGRFEFKISNRGGLPVHSKWTATLRDLKGNIIVSDNSPIHVKPFKDEIDFLRVPANIQGGYYYLEVIAPYGQSKRGELTSKVLIKGVITLSLRLNKNSYQPKSKASVTYEIHAGMGAWDTQLKLRLYKLEQVNEKKAANRYPSSLQSLSWPMYRHDRKRQGATFGIGIYQANRIKILWRKKLSRQGNNIGSPSSPVAGDFDGDGLADLAGINAQGHLIALRGFDGKKLWEVVTNARGNPSLAKLTKQKELAIIVLEGQCELAAYRARSGKLLWSQTIGTNCQLAGNPLIADLDGDGRLEIAVTAHPKGQTKNFPNIFTILDNTGKIKYKISQQQFNWPEATSLSAGDLGSLCQLTTPKCGPQTRSKDQKLELIASSYGPVGKFSGFYGDLSIYITGAFNPSGSTRWHHLAETYYQGLYHLERAFSLPIIGDLDGDGQNEIIALKTKEIEGRYVHSKVQVLQGNTGIEKWSKEIKNLYKSAIAIYPASNNKKRIAVVSKGTNKNQPFVLVSILDDKGQLLWTKKICDCSEDDVHIHIADVTGDLQPDLIIQTNARGTTGGGLISFSNHPSGNYFVGGLFILNLTTKHLLQLTDIASPTPPIVADLNGDGLVEIITGSNSGEYIVLTGAPDYFDDSQPFKDPSGNRLIPKIFMTKTISVPPISLPNFSQKDIISFDTPTESGNYILSGTLHSITGKELAKASIPLYVNSQKEIQLQAWLDKTQYILGERVTLQGKISNIGQRDLSGLNLKISTSTNNTLKTESNIQLKAKKFKQFTASWIPQKSGVHFFIVEVSDSNNITQKVKIPFTIKSLPMTMNVRVPQCVNDELFEIRVELNNKSRRAGKVILEISSRTFSKIQEVEIAPQSSKTVFFRDRITANTNYTLKARGAHQETKQIQVAFCLQATLSVPPIGIVPSGTVALPYLLKSTSKIGGHYPVTFIPPKSLSNLTNEYQAIHYLPPVKSGQPAVEVQGTAYLYLPKGVHEITYKTFGSSGKLTVVVGEPNGKIQLSGEKIYYQNQAISIKYSVKNLEKLKSHFIAQFSIIQSGVTLYQRQKQWELESAPLGQKQGMLQIPPLAVGQYELTAELFPGNQVTLKFQVVDAIKLKLTAIAKQKTERSYSFDSIVENQGYKDFRGHVSVDVGFFKSWKKVTLKAGNKVVLHWTIPLKQAPIGKRYISIRLHNEAGQAIAEATLSLERQRDLVVLTPPKQGLIFKAGDVGKLTYHFENKSPFSHPVTLKVRVMEREYRHQIELKGHEKKDIIIEFPLPKDLEERSYVAIHHWKTEEEVLAQPSSSGLTRFSVKGLAVDVQYSLDKRLYHENETAILTLKLKLIGSIKRANISIRARFGKIEQVKKMELTNQIQEVKLSLSLGDLTHTNLMFQISTTSGRSLYINSILIHAKKGHVWCLSDKDIYQAGEIVKFTLTASQKSSVNLVALESYQPPLLRKSYTLFKDKSIQDSFRLPKNIIGGTYFIKYSYGQKTQYYMFNVKAPIVIAQSLLLDKKSYQPQEKIETELYLEAKGNYELTIIYKFLLPSGIIHSTAMKKEISVQKGINMIRTTLTTPSIHEGSALIEAEIFLRTNKELSLSRILARFDVGDFYIRAIRPEKENYPVGSDALIYIDLYSKKKVRGELILWLDGQIITRRQHTQEGISTLSVNIDKAHLSRKGLYSLTGKFIVNGTVSQALGHLNIVESSVPTIEITGVKDGAFYNKTVWPFVRIQGANIIPRETSILLNKLPFANGSPVERENSYTLIAKAQDIRGQKALKKLSFIVDKTAPKIIFSNIEENKDYKALTPKILIEEKYLKSSAIILDGASFSLGTTIKEIGTHTLIVKATDKAGNHSEAKIHFNIIAGTGLTLRIDEPLSGSLVSKHLVEVLGWVHPATTKITIDGIPATVDEKGHFKGIAHLQQCHTTITINANDMGLEKEVQINVELLGKHHVPLHLKRLKSFEYPITGLAILKDELYISLASEGKIYKAQLKDGTLSSPTLLSDAVEQPTLLLTNDKGELLILDASQERLVKLDKNLKLEKISETLPQLTYIATDRQNFIVGAASNSRHLMKLEAGKWQKWLELPSNGTISSLTWDPFNNKRLLITDNSSEKIWQVQNKKITPLFSLPFSIQAIATNPDNIFWLSPNKEPSLHRYEDKTTSKYLRLPQTIRFIQPHEKTLIIATTNNIYLSTPSQVKCSSQKAEKQEYPDGQFIAPGCHCSTSQEENNNFPLTLFSLFLFLLITRLRRQKK